MATRSPKRLLVLMAIMTASCASASVFAASSVKIKAKPPENKTPRKIRRQDEKKLQSMEDVWNKALLSQNGPMLEPMIADDFLGISANGTLSNKSQYVDRVSTRHFKFNSIEVQDAKIRVMGDVALVTSLARVDLVLAGTPLQGLYRYTRVYKRYNGEWKIINFEATRAYGAAPNSEMNMGMPMPAHAKAPAAPTAPAPATQKP